MDDSREPDGGGHSRRGRPLQQQQQASPHHTGLTGGDEAAVTTTLYASLDDGRNLTLVCSRTLVTQSPPACRPATTAASQQLPPPSCGNGAGQDAETAMPESAAALFITRVAHDGRREEYRSAGAGGPPHRGATGGNSGAAPPQGRTMTGRPLQPPLQSGGERVTATLSPSRDASFSASHRDCRDAEVDAVEPADRRGGGPVTATLHSCRSPQPSSAGGRSHAAASRRPASAASPADESNVITLETEYIDIYELSMQASPDSRGRAKRCAAAQPETTTPSVPMTAARPDRREPSTGHDVGHGQPHDVSHRQPHRSHRPAAERRAPQLSVALGVGLADVKAPAGKETGATPGSEAFAAAAHPPVNAHAQLGGHGQEVAAAASPEPRLGSCNGAPDGGRQRASADATRFGGQRTVGAAEHPRKHSRHLKSQPPPHHPLGPYRLLNEALGVELPRQAAARARDGDVCAELSPARRRAELRAAGGGARATTTHYCHDNGVNDSSTSSDSSRSGDKDDDKRLMSRLSSEGLKQFLHLRQVVVDRATGCRRDKHRRSGTRAGASGARDDGSAQRRRYGDEGLVAAVEAHTTELGGNDKSVTRWPSHRAERAHDRQGDESDDSPPPEGALDDVHSRRRRRSQVRRIEASASRGSPQPPERSHPSAVAATTAIPERPKSGDSSLRRASSPRSGSSAYDTDSDLAMSSSSASAISISLTELCSVNKTHSRKDGDAFAISESATRGLAVTECVNGDAKAIARQVPLAAATKRRLRHDVANAFDSGISPVAAAMGGSRRPHSSGAQLTTGAEGRVKTRTSPGFNVEAEEALTAASLLRPAASHEMSTMRGAHIVNDASIALRADEGSNGAIVVNRVRETAATSCIDRSAPAAVCADAELTVTLLYVGHHAADQQRPSAKASTKTKVSAAAGLPHLGRGASDSEHRKAAVPPATMPSQNPIDEQPRCVDVVRCSWKTRGCPTRLSPHSTAAAPACAQGRDADRPGQRLAESAIKFGGRSVDGGVHGTGVDAGLDDDDDVSYRAGRRSAPPDLAIDDEAKSCCVDAIRCVCRTRSYASWLGAATRRPEQTTATSQLKRKQPAGDDGFCSRGGEVQRTLTEIAAPGAAKTVAECAGMNDDEERPPFRDPMAADDDSCVDAVGCASKTRSYASWLKSGPGLKWGDKNIVTVTEEAATTAGAKVARTLATDGQLVGYRVAEPKKALFDAPTIDGGVTNPTVTIAGEIETEPCGESLARRVRSKGEKAASPSGSARIDTTIGVTIDDESREAVATRISRDIHASHDRRSATSRLHRLGASDEAQDYVAVIGERCESTAYAPFSTAVQCRPSLTREPFADAGTAVCFLERETQRLVAQSDRVRTAKGLTSDEEGSRSAGRRGSPEPAESRDELCGSCEDGRAAAATGVSKVGTKNARLCDLDPAFAGAMNFQSLLRTYDDAVGRAEVAGVRSQQDERHAATAAAVLMTRERREIRLDDLTQCEYCEADCVCSSASEATSRNGPCCPHAATETETIAREIETWPLVAPLLDIAGEFGHFAQHAPLADAAEATVAAMLDEDAMQPADGRPRAAAAVIAAARQVLVASDCLSESAAASYHGSRLGEAAYATAPSQQRAETASGSLRQRVVTLGDNVLPLCHTQGNFVTERNNVPQRAYRDVANALNGNSETRVAAANPQLTQSPHHQLPSPAAVGASLRQRSKSTAWKKNVHWDATRGCGGSGFGNDGGCNGVGSGWSGGNRLDTGDRHEEGRQGAQRNSGPRSPSESESAMCTPVPLDRGQQPSGETLRSLPDIGSGSELSFYSALDSADVAHEAARVAGHSAASHMPEAAPTVSSTTRDTVVLGRPLSFSYDDRDDRTRRDSPIAPGSERESRRPLSVASTDTTADKGVGRSWAERPAFGPVPRSSAEAASSRAVGGFDHRGNAPHTGSSACDGGRGSIRTTNARETTAPSGGCATATDARAVAASRASEWEQTIAFALEEIDRSRQWAGGAEWAVHASRPAATAMIASSMTSPHVKSDSIAVASNAGGCAAVTTRTPPPGRGGVQIPDRAFVPRLAMSDYSPCLPAPQRASAAGRREPSACGAGGAVGVATRDDGFERPLEMFEVTLANNDDRSSNGVTADGSDQRPPPEAAGFQCESAPREYFMSAKDLDYRFGPYPHISDGDRQKGVAAAARMVACASPPFASGRSPLRCGSFAVPEEELTCSPVRVILTEDRDHVLFTAASDGSRPAATETALDEHRAHKHRPASSAHARHAAVAPQLNSATAVGGKPEAEILTMGRSIESDLQEAARVVAEKLLAGSYASRPRVPPTLPSTEPNGHEPGGMSFSAVIASDKNSDSAAASRYGPSTQPLRQSVDPFLPCTAADAIEVAQRASAEDTGLSAAAATQAPPLRRFAANQSSGPANTKERGASASLRHGSLQRLPGPGSSRIPDSDDGIAPANGRLPKGPPTIPESCPATPAYGACSAFSSDTGENDALEEAAAAVVATTAASDLPLPASSDAQYADLPPLAGFVYCGYPPAVGAAVGLPFFPGAAAASSPPPLDGLGAQPPPFGPPLADWTRRGGEGTTRIVTPPRSSRCLGDRDEEQVKELRFPSATTSPGYTILPGQAGGGSSAVVGATSERRERRFTLESDDADDDSGGVPPVRREAHSVARRRSERELADGGRSPRRLRRPHSSDSRIGSPARAFGGGEPPAKKRVAAPSECEPDSAAAAESRARTPRTSDGMPKTRDAAGAVRAKGARKKQRAAPTNREKDGEDSDEAVDDDADESEADEDDDSANESGVVDGGDDAAAATVGGDAKTQPELVVTSVERPLGRPSALKSALRHGGGSQPPSLAATTTNAPPVMALSTTAELGSSNSISIITRSGNVQHLEQPSAADADPVVPATSASCEIAASPARSGPAACLRPVAAEQRGSAADARQAYSESPHRLEWQGTPAAAASSKRPPRTRRPAKRLDDRVRSAADGAALVGADDELCESDDEDGDDNEAAAADDDSDLASGGVCPPRGPPATVAGLTPMHSSDGGHLYTGGHWAVKAASTPIRTEQARQEGAARSADRDRDVGGTPSVATSFGDDEGDRRPPAANAVGCGGAPLDGYARSYGGINNLVCGGATLDSVSADPTLTLGPSLPRTLVTTRSAAPRSDSACEAELSTPPAMDCRHVTAAVAATTATATPGSRPQASVTGESGSGTVVFAAAVDKLCRGGPSREDGHGSAAKPDVGSAKQQSTPADSANAIRADLSTVVDLLATESTRGLFGPPQLDEGTGLPSLALGVDQAIAGGAPQRLAPSSRVLNASAAGCAVDPGPAASNAGASASAAKTITAPASESTMAVPDEIAAAFVVTKPTEFGATATASATKASTATTVAAKASVVGGPAVSPAAEASRAPAAASATAVQPQASKPAAAKASLTALPAAPSASEALRASAAGAAAVQPLALDGEKASAATLAAKPAAADARANPPAPEAADARANPPAPEVAGLQPLALGAQTAADSTSADRSAAAPVTAFASAYGGSGSAGVGRTPTGGPDRAADPAAIEAGIAARKEISPKGSGGELAVAADSKAATAQAGGSEPSSAPPLLLTVSPSSLQTISATRGGGGSAAAGTATAGGGGHDLTRIMRDLGNELTVVTAIANATPEQPENLLSSSKIPTAEQNGYGSETQRRSYSQVELAKVMGEIVKSLRSLCDVLREQSATGGVGSSQQPSPSDASSSNRRSLDREQKLRVASSVLRRYPRNSSLPADVRFKDRSRLSRRMSPTALARSFAKPPSKGKAPPSPGREKKTPAAATRGMLRAGGGSRKAGGVSGIPGMTASAPNAEIQQRALKSRGSSLAQAYGRGTPLPQPALQPPLVGNQPSIQQHK